MSWPTAEQCQKVPAHTNSRIYSLTYPLSHLPTHSPTHHTWLEWVDLQPSCVRGSRTNTLSHSLTYKHTNSLTHSLTHSLYLIWVSWPTAELCKRFKDAHTHTFPHLLTDSLTYPHTQTHTHSFSIHNWSELTCSCAELCEKVQPHTRAFTYLLTH